MDGQRSPNKKQQPQGFGYRMLELRALGLEPQDARKLLISISRWKKARGNRGATDFCSSLEATMKAYLNGEPAPRTSPWVKTVKGFPKQLLFLRKYSRNIQRRLVPVKRLIQESACDTANIKKFLDATSKTADRDYIERLKPVDALVRGALAYCKRELSLPSMSTPSYRALDYLELVYLKASSKAKGEKLERKVVLTVLSDLQHLLHFPELAGNIYIASAMRKFQHLPISELLNKVFNGGGDYRDLAFNCGETWPSSVGSLTYASEPGMKMRTAASPRLPYQAALYPLFEVLMSFLDVLPSDCTTNQEAGALWASAQLAKGKTVWSVDTSSATDTTPYWCQRRVLKELGICRHMIQLLDSAVTGYWNTPKAFKVPGGRMRWTRGQPLGLQPSFALYALFHNLLLIGICLKNRVGVDCFRILGDDIVISEAVVYEDYRRALALMEVEVSEPKTYTSDSYAEFAGYYIGPDFLQRAGKFRELKPDNFLQKVRDPDMIFPELLIPRRLRSKVKKMCDSYWPEGFIPLDDVTIKSYTTDQVYDLINHVLKPYNGSVRHIETETYKVVKFELGMILDRGYTSEQVACERFLAKQSYTDCMDRDLFDPERINISFQEVAPHQYDIVVLAARVMFHVLTNHHKDALEISQEIPMLSGYQGYKSRMAIVEDIILRLPLRLMPTEVDEWCFLKKLQKGYDPKEILDTSKTVIKHWKRESSTLRVM